MLSQHSFQQLNNSTIMYHVFLYKNGTLMTSLDEEFNSAICHLFDEDQNSLSVSVAPQDEFFPEHLSIKTKVYTDEGIATILNECINMLGIKWRCVKELTKGSVLVD